MEKTKIKISEGAEDLFDALDKSSIALAKCMRDLENMKKMLELGLQNTEIVRDSFLIIDKEENGAKDGKQ